LGIIVRAIKRNHTKCPGSKTFEPAEEQVFRTSDVVFSWLAPCSPLERGAGGVLGRTQQCLTYNLRFTNYDLNPKS